MPSNSWLDVDSDHDVDKIIFKRIFTIAWYGSFYEFRW